MFSGDVLIFASSVIILSIEVVSKLAVFFFSSNSTCTLVATCHALSNRALSVNLPL